MSNPNALARVAAIAISTFETLVTIIGVFVIFIIASSGKGNLMFVLLVLGAFIFLLSLFEILKLEMGQNFWNGVLIIIVIVAILWFIFRNKGIFNK
ncbi:MAG: hypothetical protein IJ471_08805 [Eubacterium sp.]|nr:hypothetical protein [Eubacterium sp.]